jgi:hypothetical protein
MTGRDQRHNDPVPPPATSPAAPWEEAAADALVGDPVQPAPASDRRAGPDSTRRSGGIRPGWAVAAAALVSAAPLLVTIG